MTTTPLNVSLNDFKTQTEAQGAGIELQSRFLFVVDIYDARVGSSDAAAGLAPRMLSFSRPISLPPRVPRQAMQRKLRSACWTRSAER